MEAAILVALVAILTAGLALGWYFKTRQALLPVRSDRRISLWAFAELHRLVFDDPQANSLLGMLGFKLIASLGLVSDTQLPLHGADNSLSGDWDGTRVIIADWWVQETGASIQPGPIGVAIGAPRLVAQFHTVVWLDVGQFPHLLIRRSGMLREGSERLLGTQVDFELEAFNRSFAVEANERQVAFDIIDARMMRWLLDTSTPFDIELGLGGLLVRATRLLAPEEIEAFVETAIEFVQTIPAHARTKFAPREPIAPQAAQPAPPPLPPPPPPPPPENPPPPEDELDEP